MFDVLVGADHDRRGDFSKIKFRREGFFGCCPPRGIVNYRLLGGRHVLADMPRRLELFIADRTFQSGFASIAFWLWGLRQVL
jgi:hypothetical protein